MRLTGPILSIGMPVYNGEQFLEESLDSLSAQTFEDYELVISDNGSTDRTGEICQKYAMRDKRIRYFRNDCNLGAAWNYNRVFKLSAGKYFKWSAHDDICAPEFLERCIQALESDYEVVLSYSKSRVIDEIGRIVKELEVDSRISSSKPYKRFLASVFSPPVVQVFGVVRSSILRKTPLIGSFSGSDRALAAELALAGRFYEIPEYMFFVRQHEDQSSGAAYPTRHARQAWFDPRRAGKISFPHWRLFLEHLLSIKRSPLKRRDQIWTYVYLGRWAVRQRKNLTRNMILKEM